MSQNCRTHASLLIYICNGSFYKIVYSRGKDDLELEPHTLIKFNEIIYKTPTQNRCIFTQIPVTLLLYKKKLLKKLDVNEKQSVASFK